MVKGSWGCVALCILLGDVEKSALEMCGSSVSAGCADYFCIFSCPHPLLSRRVWDPGALSRAPERSHARLLPQC